jgi:hypothetical protein
VARRAGRNARVFMSLASGGTAEPIAFVKSNSLSAATDKFEVTAFGDGNKIYVAGLPDSSGSFDFWYDDATTQTYTAAVDGIARKFYFYPDFVNSPTVYWYGTWLVDFSITATVDGAIDGSASWNAASTILKSTA